MDYALINDNVVKNIILADAEFVASIATQWQHIEALDEASERSVGIGWGWTAQGGFTAPVVPPAPPAPPLVWEWFIDIGPFYDRFGAAKMDVLTSADAGVKAILADLNIRKWVDLKRSDVAQALSYVGSAVPSVTMALQNTILNTPVSDVENLALRKLYFES